MVAVGVSVRRESVAGASTERGDMVTIGAKWERPSSARPRMGIGLTDRGSR
jgi:hypothetical protein